MQHATHNTTAPNKDIMKQLNNHTEAVHFIFNQMGVKAGVKKLGQKAIDAIISECRQLDEQDALHPVLKKDLSNLDLKRALRAITLIKEKRCP